MRSALGPPSPLGEGPRVRSQATNFPVLASERRMSDKVGPAALSPSCFFRIPINFESRVFQIPKAVVGEVYPVSIRELKRLVLDLFEGPSDQRLFRSSPLPHGIRHGLQFCKDNLAGNELYLALFVLATAAHDLFQDEPLDFGVIFNAFEKCVSQLDGLIGGQSFHFAVKNFEGHEREFGGPCGLKSPRDMPWFPFDATLHHVVSRLKRYPAAPSSPGIEELQPVPHRLGRKCCRQLQ
jgi:hypothetical protein